MSPCLWKGRRKRENKRDESQSDSLRDGKTVLRWCPPLVVEEDVMTRTVVSWEFFFLFSARTLHKFVFLIAFHYRLRIRGILLGRIRYRLRIDLDMSVRLSLQFGRKQFTALMFTIA